MDSFILTPNEQIDNICNKFQYEVLILLYFLLTFMQTPVGDFFVLLSARDTGTHPLVLYFGLDRLSQYTVKAV